MKFSTENDKAAQEVTVLVDTTVQEKMITCPTDSKRLIKIINRLNKLAKVHGIQKRRTFVKETNSLRLACRYFRHFKRWKLGMKAKQAGELMQLDHMSVGFAEGFSIKEFKATCPITGMAFMRAYSRTTSRNATRLLQHLIKSSTLCNTVYSGRWWERV